MNYDMKVPCAKCPFRRGTPMRLLPARIREIERAVNQHNGATFPCHETVDYSNSSSGRATERTQHCAGALIYAEKHGVSSQLTRISERLGMYRIEELADDSLVWDDLDEWLENGSIERNGR